MIPEEVKKLNISLGRFLTTFQDCFRSISSYDNFQSYIRGQLSDIQRKNVKNIALRAEKPIRTLQGFLETGKWDHNRTRDHLQAYVRRKHSSEEQIGIVDGTYFAKDGTHTAGVKRQWNGTEGKIGNCVVAINLTYCSGSFFSPVDYSIYLPEKWIQNEQKRKQANIPDQREYRAKQEIAFEQIRRAKRNQLHFDWITYDEEFGKSPSFLEGLEQIDQPSIGEIPTTATGWLEKPEVICRKENWPKRGRDPHFPVLHPDAPEATGIEEIALEELDQKEWKKVHIKDTSRGPEIWEVKTAEFYHSRKGLPSVEQLLVVAKNPFTGEVKYFLAYNPQGADLSTLLRVAFTRSEVEKGFREGKQQVGLGDFEVRNFPPLKRHLLISLVSHLFISEQTDRLQEDYPALTKPQVRLAVDRMIETLKDPPRRREAKIRKACQRIRYTQKRNEASYRAHRKRRNQELKEKGYQLKEMLSCVQKQE